MRVGSDLKSLEGLDLEYFTGDLLHFNSLYEACQGIDFVIHAGGKIAGAEEKFEEFAAVNITGTRNIVQAAEKAGVKRLVYVSSYSVFGGGSHDLPGTELSEYTGFRFNSGYMNSKYLAQQWVLSEVEKTRFPVIVVNPTLMIGPYDSRPSSGEMILRILNQTIQFCPMSRKNFIDVRDAAIGTCNALTMGIPGECYILAGENLSFDELYEKVNRIYGHNGFRLKMPAPMLNGAGFIGKIVRALSKTNLWLNLVFSRQLGCDSCFSAGKAKRVLGLPQRPVDETIRDAIAWFIANGYLPAGESPGEFSPIAA